jgi:Uma2 family endonuclease
MLTAPRVRTWQEVLNDPALQDLPYKIELNERGQLLMSPVTKRHSWYAIRISDLLRDHQPTGHRYAECSVLTSQGVRVADIAWASIEHHESEQTELFTTAPEICIEIISPSNTDLEIRQKIKLYLEAGALEVWTCNLEGKVRFYSHDGLLEHSDLVPAMPVQIA